MRDKRSNKMETKEITNVPHANEDKLSSFLKELSKQTGFRLKDLYLFYKDGIITGEGDKDLKTLTLIHRIWFSRTYIRRCLSYLTKNQRRYLISTCDISKPELFVMSRIQSGESVKKIYKSLLIQLKQFYNLSTEQAKKTISKAARRERKRRYYKRPKVEK